MLDDLKADFSAVNTYVSTESVAGDTVHISSLDKQATFLDPYGWALNIYPTISEVIANLRAELNRLRNLDLSPYQKEVSTNIFLLACAISDTVDDYLLGNAYDFGKIANVLSVVSPAIRGFERILRLSRKSRELLWHGLRRWRTMWQAAVESYLENLVAPGASQQLAESVDRLEKLLLANLPESMKRTRIRVPAAFRSQDLTHFDVVRLGNLFAKGITSHSQPIVMVGLRTAGSYFTPLLVACLRVQGFANVSAVTLRPKRGIGPWEEESLSRSAKEGAIAVIADEPIYSGKTASDAADVLVKMGFTRDRITILVPTHATHRTWKKSVEALAFSQMGVLTLEPEHWYKYEQLEPALVEARLQSYFHRNGYTKASVVVHSPQADRFNSFLRNCSEERFHVRLKRVYEFRLQDRMGTTHTRYVMAKSVGWGWLSYHALIAATKLSQFLPPILGFEDGIIYAEWLPQSDPVVAGSDRDAFIDRIAHYVAARTRGLALGSDPTRDLSRDNRHKGLEILSGILSGAYGWKGAAVLKRARIQQILADEACPVPVLIDGKMNRKEWVWGESRTVVKTDFEHHGLGKTEPDITDPAYDLAEAMLHFQLSPEEQRRLISCYRKNSGDMHVERRLILNKILAGTRSVERSTFVLGDQRLLHMHAECNREYFEARRFLTLQTAMHCAKLLHKPEKIAWSSPLVVLDVDGVIDKQIFGYPSTTFAGIRALSVLHAHNFSTILNTARTLQEVKEYSDVFCMLGGIAEYGSVIYDGMSRQQRVMVSTKSLQQIERVRDALVRIPGVFLDDTYEYSIRAFTYERQRTIPIPTTTIKSVLAGLQSDRLTYHQTYTDTAVVATDVDKGKALAALLDMIGMPDLKTIAVGDSSADLPMFHAATRSFAPSHISCRSLARALGCKIASKPYQTGLLEIAFMIAHPDGRRCEQCRLADKAEFVQDDIVLQLLRTADKEAWRLLLDAVTDPMSIRTFAV